MTTNFDGQAAADAILAHGQAALFGGRFYEDQPDDAELDFTKPYAIVSFGDPIPYGGDRSLAGEARQPYILPVTVEVAGATATIVRDATAAVRRVFIDWTPVAGDTTPMRGAGGQRWTTRSSGVRPAQFHRAVYLECIINQSS